MATFAYNRTPVRCLGGGCAASIRWRRSGVQVRAVTDGFSSPKPGGDSPGSIIISTQAGMSGSIAVPSSRGG